MAAVLTALTAAFGVRLPGGPQIEGRLTVPAGVTVLFGPSGAGKTTVLRALAGLVKPDTGFVRLGDTVWSDAGRGVFVPPHRRGAGVVFQDGALFPHLSALGNVAYGTGDPDAARPLLERLGLTALSGRLPATLSGGERQRVALARALAPSPRVLLLDEPLSSLDGPAREELRTLLRKVLPGLGIPVVLVTHDRIEALALGDRLAVLADGRVLQEGPVAEVFHRPADAVVARAVGVDTLAEAEVLDREDGLLVLACGAARIVAVDPGGVESEVYLLVRGEDVLLTRETAGASSARNRLPARVLELTPEGPLVRVTLDAGFPLSALVTRPAAAELDLAPGLAVTALLKAPAIHVVPRA